VGQSVGSGERRRVLVLPGELHLELRRIEGHGRSQNLCSLQISNHSILINQNALTTH
jgi:hypothetical protein